jgi:hypothetical protein
MALDITVTATVEIIPWERAKRSSGVDPTDAW